MAQFGKRFICQNHLEGTPLKPDRLHVSLQHVGDYKRLPAKFVYAARQAGSAVSMSRFEVTFGFIRSFDCVSSIGGEPCKRPLVMLGQGDGLLDFHRRLSGAMEKNGLRSAKTFTPHMTLFYGRTPIPLQAIEPIRLAVTEFALVHSKLSLTQYDMVDRWSLRG